MVLVGADDRTRTVWTTVPREMFSKATSAQKGYDRCLDAAPSGKAKFLVRSGRKPCFALTKIKLGHLTNIRPTRFMATQTKLRKLTPVLSHDDVAVFLGDYIDRGPDARGCLERIFRFRAECEWVVLGVHRVG